MRHLHVIVIIVRPVPAKGNGEWTGGIPIYIGICIGVYPSNTMLFEGRLAVAHTCLSCRFAVAFVKDNTSSETRMSEQASFRFFQISDTLFDSAAGLKSLELSPAKRKERTEEGFAALEKVLTSAVDEQADAVIVGGNLFNAEMVTTGTISRLQTIFARLRQTPIIVSPGEHDCWSNDSMYNQQAVVALGLNRWPPNVYVFCKSDYGTIRLPARPNVSITCRPYIEKTAPEFDGERLSALKRDDSRIKVLIRPLPSAHHIQPGAPEPSGPSADEVEHYGFTYAVFSGLPTCHIVNGSNGIPVAACAGTLFGQSEVDAGRRVALFCTLKVDETNQTTATVELREFDQRRIIVASVDLGNVSPDLRADKFRAALNRAGARDGQDIVILKLIGTYAAGLPPEINLEEFRKRYYHVKFEDHSRPDYLVNATPQTPTEQRFLELIAELRAASSSEAARGDLIDDTMYFGLAALREGRILIRDAD